MSFCFLYNVVSVSETGGGGGGGGSIASSRSTFYFRELVTMCDLHESNIHTIAHTW